MTKRFVSNEFSQFGAKAVLSVSSAPLPSVFPAWQRKISFRFSTCKGVADLHEHFQRIRAKTDLGQRTPVPPGQRLAQLESFLNQEQGHLIERGYFAPVARRGKRHVTLKGAYLMTWKMAWPSKPILIWLADRRTERAAA